MLRLVFALVKAAVVLLVLLFVGQRLMRGWFHIVARRRSHELFILNVLAHHAGALRGSRSEPACLWPWARSSPACS